MATNVSSLRVAIRGDVSGFEAALIKGEKAASEFAKTLSKSATTRQGLAGSNGLDRQLSDVRRQIDAMADAYVTGGKVARSEIDALIAKETQLTSRIEARKTLLASARGTLAGLQEIETRPFVGPLLPPGGVAQIRAAAAATGKFGFSSGQASLAVSQLGFAAEDALVSYGNQGLGGALRAAGNNLSFVAAMMNPIAGLTVGIGTALAAIFIPKMFQATDATKSFAAALKLIEGVNFRDALLRLQGSLPVPGVTDAPTDRFQAARDSFNSALADQRGQRDSARAQIRSVFEAAGLGGPGFVDAINAATIDAMTRRNPEHLVNQARVMFRNAGAGDEFTPEVAERLRELARQAILASVQVERTNKALEQTAKNAAEAAKLQKEADNKKAAVALVTPLAEAGANLFAGVWKDMQTAAGQRDELREMSKNTRKPSQGLAGGFEFGSREAVSTLNRAMFRSIGEKKEEKEIAKNTHGTEVAVRDVVRAVRDLGSQFVPALAGEPL